MEQAQVVVTLLILLALLVVASNKLGLPYPVVLVIGGLTLSFIPHLPELGIKPEYVFFFFLPPLLYPAALFTSWRDFRRNLRPILFLAIGLVLVTMIAVGWAAHTLAGLPWAAALALGAIVSPPDAVAADAVIKRLPIPQRIEAILEGESLVNDATALVALQFAVAALVTGNFSLGQASLRFVYVALGGIAIGLVVGFIMRWVQRQLDDPPLQISISLCTPFAAYLLGERLHTSGVLAVVTAGIYLGWHAPVTWGARTRLQGYAFWETIVFILNGLIFIAIGLQLPRILRALKGESLLHLAVEGLFISLCVVFVRILWVFPATYLSRWFDRKKRLRYTLPPLRESILISWCGMRGVVSLTAAFGLPLTLANSENFPGRSYILFFTFCVILTTLVFQGLTLPLVIRSFCIGDDGLTDNEERAARLEANRAAIAFLEEKEKGATYPHELIEHLRLEYDERLAQLEASAENPEERGGGIATPKYQRLQHAALRRERETIIRLRNQNVINDAALRRIQRDLDLAEARLDHA